MIVLHYTAMASAEAALQRLCDPVAEVSAHYLIGRDGALYQMVAEEERAWHAGRGSWGAATDVNSRSIGIELDNDGGAPFSSDLMARLEALLGEVMARWEIAPARVIGHSDMAPDRKQDPGRRFDWGRLAATGLVVWPEAGPIGSEEVSARAFRAAAEAFGYPSSASDAQLLGAFRQRFRPWDHGPLVAADVAAITDLARRFPVDVGAKPL